MTFKFEKPRVSVKKEERFTGRIRLLFKAFFMKANAAGAFKAPAKTIEKTHRRKINDLSLDFLANGAILPPSAFLNGLK